MRRLLAGAPHTASEACPACSRPVLATQPTVRLRAGQVAHRDCATYRIRTEDRARWSPARAAPGPGD